MCYSCTSPDRFLYFIWWIVVLQSVSSSTWLVSLLYLIDVTLVHDLGYSYTWFIRSYFYLSFGILVFLSYSLDTEDLMNEKLSKLYNYCVILWMFLIRFSSLNRPLWKPDSGYSHSHSHFTLLSCFLFSCCGKYIIDY